MEVQNNTSVIQQHATWVAVNPIEGCPKQCKYCFMQANSRTGVVPRQIVSPEETIKQLINSKYYTLESVLAFFTETDAFATVDNREYFKKLLLLCDESNIKNTKVFITKCHIPDEFIELFKDLRSKGHNIIVYLSYSGLDSSIERGVNHQHIKENFIRLKKAGQPVIHYWRPFLPQNSSKEKINEVIEFVSKYALASVTAGLKIKKSFKSKLDFWPELLEMDDSIIDAEGVWPEHVIPILKRLMMKYKNYPIFQSNSCALAHALKVEDNNAFYNSELCNDYNNCPNEQRKRCHKFYLNYNLNSKAIKSAFDKLKININPSDCIFDKDTLTLQIPTVSLTVAQITFLTQNLRCRINAMSAQNDMYWNTSVNGRGPLKIPITKGEEYYEQNYSVCE